MTKKSKLPYVDMSMQEAVPAEARVLRRWNEQLSQTLGAGCVRTQQEVHPGATVTQFLFALSDSDPMTRVKSGVGAHLNNAEFSALVSLVEGYIARWSDQFHAKRWHLSTSRKYEIKSNGHHFVVASVYATISKVGAEEDSRREIAHFIVSTANLQHQVAASFAELADAEADKEA